MSVNSAARRCATSRAPSSTTTAPRTARLTYSSSSTGAAALSPARNGARTEGIWEVTATVIGTPEVRNVVPEEAMLSRLESRLLAASAVSPPSAAAYTQVTCISLGPSADSISGSAPAPMKTAPLQYCCAEEPCASTGLAAAALWVQKAAAGSAGRMIPVTTSSTVPAFSREPTRSPSLAAVSVVTATWTTVCCPAASPPAGSRPATIWLYRASAVR